MTLEIGDVVQVTKDCRPPVGNREAQPHPLFRMLGVVAEFRSGDHIGVYFYNGPLSTEGQYGLPYMVFYFASDEITKVGVAPVQPNLEGALKEINRRQEKFFAARPELQELLRRHEEAEKWKHLPFGSPEAKEHGCTCDEIRAFDCWLHGHTVGEVYRKQAEAEKVIEDLEADEK